MVLSAAGCGPPAEVRPVLIPVQGSLLVNGKPAAGAMVVFHPAGGTSIDERGSRPKATVLPDGSFEVTTYQAGDGAPAGDYDVAVLWLVNNGGDSSWDKLRGAYADPERTNLRVSIDEQGGMLDPIRIDGAAIAPPPPPSADTDFDQVD